ncbi:MAG: hypothetical protein GY861_21085 [bacterium]|nr:hypothetical protein [bacterium]
MDIRSGSKYPEKEITNFAPHVFYVNGVKCNSMEGFLQALKYSNREMQIYVCTLVGRAAKFKGKKKAWWRTQTLYWLDEEIDRHSRRYQELLWEAYNALGENTSFRRALLATGDAVLKHSIGKRDPHRTVLTKREFCSLLASLRAKIKKEEADKKKEN